MAGILQVMSVLGEQICNQTGRNVSGHAKSLSSIFYLLICVADKILIGLAHKIKHYDGIKLTLLESLSEIFALKKDERYFLVANGCKLVFSAGDTRRVFSQF